MSFKIFYQSPVNNYHVQQQIAADREMGRRAVYMASFHTKSARQANLDRGTINLANRHLRLKYFFLMNALAVPDT